MSTTSPRRAGNSDWSPLATLVLIGLVALFAYKWWTKPQPVPKLPAAPVVQAAAIVPRHPPVGIGGTYRGVRIGGTFDDESNVGIELGVGKGAFGAGVTVIKFSLKDGSFVFVPDDPSVSLDLVNRTLTWSRTDGFGKQLGLSAPVTGRLIFDINADLSTSPALGRGELTLQENSWTFQPMSQFGGPSSPSTKSLIKSLDATKLESRFGLPKVPPRHVFEFGQSGLWLPAKGYVWQDGTSGFRGAGQGLDVQWNPGAASLIPPRVHAAVAEEHWEPDAGYRWTDQIDAPKATADLLAAAVEWTPGVPSPTSPNVVSSVNEGKWTPAPGYTWASSDESDLSVTPVNSP